MKRGERLVCDITVSAGLSARLGGDGPTDWESHFQSFTLSLVVGDKLLNRLVLGSALCTHHWLGLGTKQKLEIRGKKNCQVSKQKTHIKKKKKSQTQRDTYYTISRK